MIDVTLTMLWSWMMPVVKMRLYFQFGPANPTRQILTWKP